MRLELFSHKLPAFVPPAYVVVVDDDDGVIACLPPGYPITSIFAGGWYDGGGGGGVADDGRGFTIGFVDDGATAEVVSTMSATCGRASMLPLGFEHCTRERIAA